jgi:aminomuconate-semialdehyde/2-hydroxymuconate-6-semialdehyde dehydrogenase
MKAPRSVPHIIGGKEVASRDGREFDNVDPWSQQVSGRVALGGPADVEDAVGAAREAFHHSGWPHLTPRERGAILHRLADLMEDSAEDLARADVTDMGRPISGARALDVPRAVDNFRFFADSVRQATAETYPMGRAHHAYLDYEPAGVVAAITPWNHPLMLGTWKIAAPLAWGNTVVHKPAEDTPTSAHLVGLLALEAGMPPGVLNVVQGDGVAGAALAGSPGIDRVTFTGSTAVGRSISAAVAAHLTPVSLELGGKGAMVVFPDADLDNALEVTARAVFNNSGQVCLSTSRVYVHRSIHESFVDRLVQKAASLTVGDPRDPGTDLGPLASQRHAA